MQRREALLLSGALATAALAGCTGDGGDPTDEPTTQQPTETATATSTETQSPTESGEPPAGEPVAPTETLQELAAGNAAFALDLHEHLASTEGGNQFLSPYSITAALAMTYAGARGEAREQMRETLHFTLDDDIHAALAESREALAEREETTTRSGEEVDAFSLSLANAVWGREDIPFADEFLDLLDEYYQTGLRRADFASDPLGERERINDWVADATEDRIEELLPKDAITRQTVLVLTNAIFFEAEWHRKFDPDDTEDGTFTAIDGAESSVTFMHQHLKAQYASTPRADVLELPYLGEDVSMVLLLPREGEFRAFERDLDPDWLFGAFDELAQHMGDLALPKFEFETSLELFEPLSELGMPTAFSSSADFSGFLEGGGGDLAIDEVYHDTFVSVDEEGTEAAAATSVVIPQSGAPSWDELRFDRPFLFCIRDRPTDAILFLGRVVDAGTAQE